MAIVSSLFPYQTQNFLYRYLGTIFVRNQILKVILPNNCEYDRIYLSSFINKLKLNHKKVSVREIECEKNSSPMDMLTKGKGDLTILSSISCLTQKDKVKAISTAGEKALYIFAPKNYGFTEFQKLSGKKIGFVGDTFTGNYIIERLIQFYNFDIPPELNKQRIYDIEKSFSSGEIEALVWVDGINSQSIYEFLSKIWYQIVPIERVQDFSKTVPGLYVKNLNITPYGTVNLVCIKNILTVSNRISNSIVREIINAWFSSECVLYSPEYDFGLKAFTPPTFLNTHSLALAFFNKDKPLTRTELKTLGISFFFLLIAILLLRHMVYIFLKRRKKPYEKELEKRWEEIKSLKYQWEMGLSNEEVLVRLKRIKSIYNWALESYKQNFISEKAVVLLYLNILQQLLEFNERYFEYAKKNPIMSEILNEQMKNLSIKDSDEEKQALKKVSRTEIDEKDKYLKTPVLHQFSQEHEQQMFLFNEDEKIN